MAELERAFNLKLSPAGEALKEKLLAKSAAVAIIGSGYVGLPLAVALASAGLAVHCIDTNPERVHLINAGQSYIPDVAGSELARFVQSGMLQATNDFAGLGEADLILVCVPTPLTQTKDPDTTAITAAAEQIAAHLRPGQLIAVESTTYPGTVQELFLPRLTASGLQVGTDFFLCHSPERVDPGNTLVTTRTTNKVVGGCTPACLALAEHLYAQIVAEVVPVSSPTVAELTKLFENTYRAVNIALVNELALLCERMELDVWEVVAAASTKGFGIQTFWPGPGVGGHCIALDPHYLAWKAREYDFAVRFVELASTINQTMPAFVKEKLVRVLGEAGKPLRGAEILIVGVAYKRDIPDVRESPALKVIQLLQKEGARVLYHDPYVPALQPQGWFKGQLESVALTAERLQASDAVVITTDHAIVDYDAICRVAPIVLDTRNATKGVVGACAKIVKL
ncbi:MAG TPA: nucleotide sugar dehydrogenase [Symbiobacteriaceae bacterium]|nr:nucleotide sugar dehydrogenase [Symbiobacteriaceae bacterium]